MIVLSENLKKQVIFHVGHYGFLWKFILLKDIYHPHDNAVFLIDTSFINDSTKEFLKEREKLNTIGKIVLYEDMKEFCNCFSEDELSAKIDSFFTGLFDKNELFISKNSTIYSGFDERNALGIFLIKHNIPYILVDDGSLGVMNPYRGLSVSKNVGKNTYISLIQRSHALLFDSPSVSKIIWSTLNHPNLEVVNQYLDFENIVHLLTEESRHTLMGFYNIFEIKNSLENCKLYLLSSFWGSILGMTLQDFCEMYGDIISYTSCVTDNVIIKPHPNSDLSSYIMEKYFPGAEHIPGYVPSQLLFTSGFKIRQIISTTESVRDISGPFAITCLSQKTINCYREVNVPYLVYYVCSLISSKCIFEMNEERNVYYSKFIEELENHNGPHSCESGATCGIFSSLDTFFNKCASYDSSIIKWDFDFSESEFDKIVNMNLYVGAIVLREKTISRIAKTVLVFTTKNNVFYSEIQKLSLCKFLYMSRKELGAEFVSCDEVRKIIKLEKKVVQDISFLKQESFNYAEPTFKYVFNLVERSHDYAFGLKYVDYLISNPTLERISNAMFICDYMYKNGMFEAAGKMGLIYNKGLFFEKNPYLSSMYLRVAADNGVNWAKTELFGVYWSIGTPNSDKDLVDFCINLLDHNDRGAQGWLARAYRYGRGVKKDLDVALTLYRLSADNGVGWAKHELMDLLWRINTQSAHEDLLNYAQPLAFSGDKIAVEYMVKLYKCSVFIAHDENKVSFWENYLS